MSKLQNISPSELNTLAKRTPHPHPKNYVQSPYVSSYCFMRAKRILIFEHSLFLTPIQQLFFYIILLIYHINHILHLSLISLILFLYLFIYSRCTLAHKVFKNHFSSQNEYQKEQMNNHYFDSILPMSAYSWFHEICVSIIWSIICSLISFPYKLRKVSTPWVLSRIEQN